MRAALLLLLTTLSAAAQSPSPLPYQSPAAPGSWLTISGFFLSNTERAWTAADFQGTSLPTTLDGVSAKINGKSAAIASVSPRRVTLLIPSDAVKGPATLTLTTPQGTATLPLTLQPIAPRWLVAPLHANGQPVTQNEPAEPGETILLYGTGFGPTSPAVDPMIVFNGAAPLSSPTTVSIGGQRATIAFAGLIANGLYQFNVVVPPLPESTGHALTASVGNLLASILIPVMYPGPPVVTGMTPNDLIWGQQAKISLSGAGLQGLNTITISDPTRLWFNESPNQGPDFTLRVEENATPGTRTVTVTNSKGQSNAFPFTIRRGEPRITTLFPAVAWPGRVYYLRVEGTDLAAASQVEVSPPAAIRVQLGLLQLDPDVATGPYQLRISSPWDSSPPVPLMVSPAPPTAPEIRALTQFETRIYSPFPAIQQTDYTGTFQFTDRNGDVTNGARVEMLVEVNGNIAATYGIIERLPQPGTARFKCTQSARTLSTGPFPVWITLLDEAGNRSNALRSTIPIWYN